MLYQPSGGSASFSSVAASPAHHQLPQCELAVNQTYHILYQSEESQNEC